MRLRNAAKFAAEVRANRKEIQKLGKATRDADKDSVGLRVALGGLSTGLRLTALGLVVAAQGGVALVAGTVGLASAIAPLLGLVGALPGGLALVGQAFGVVKLAMMGVKDAVGPLNGAINPDKFAALSRPAQDFVLALDAMKGGVRGLQRDLAAGLFPGLLAGLIAARPALAALHDPLVDTSHVLGSFATSLGQLVGSAGFLADLHSQAAFNTVQITRLGGAGLHLVNVFRNLMVGSRGLVSWIVRGVGSFAAWADNATSAGRASGGLQRGFHTVQVATRRIVLTLWRFGVALLNIGRIGKREVGDGLLVHLLHGATALERWTRSEPGIRKIGAAFAWSRRILAGVADFMGRAAHGAGPELVALLHNVVDALNPIISSGGGVTVLSLYAHGLSMLAGAAGLLVRNVPGATFVLSAFFALLILNKVTGTLGFITRGMRLLAVTTKSLTAATAANTGVFGLSKAIMTAFAASTVGTRIGLAAIAVQESAVGVAAAGMWTAITGPVGLAVIGIAALIGGFYLLYTKVKEFRDFVNTYWPLLLGVITGPFVAIPTFIIDQFGAVKDTVGGIIDWITEKVNGLLDLPGKIAGGALSLPGKIIGGALSLPGKALGVAGDVLGSLIPGHAAGGVVTSPLQWVGEHGKELAALPMGTRVFSAPETRRMMLRAPTAPKVSGAPAMAGGRSGGPTIVRNYITVELDGRALAKAVSDVVADERAAG